jgi:hypothetical protein
VSDLFPDLTEDLGSIDADTQDDDEPEERAEVAQPPRRPRGRPRKAPPAPVPAAPAPAPETPEPISPSLRSREPETDEQKQARLSSWRKSCPKPFEEAWEWCLEHCGEQDWQPRDLIVAIINTRGGDKGEPVYMTPKIHGDQILGDPSNSYSAGEAATDWVIDYFHQDPGTPATYKARIFGPSNAFIVETEPFKLESYATIDARRRALKARADKEGGTGGRLQSPYEPPARPWALATPGFAPPATATVSVPAGTPPEMAALYQELGYLRAVREEADRAKAEGRAPRDVSAPVVVPAAAPAIDIEKRIAEAVAAAVGQAVPAVLAAAGIRPKSEEEKLAEMFARNNQAMLEAVRAMIPQAAPATPGEPPKAAEKAASTLDAIKSLFAEMNDFEKARVEMRKAMGVEDPAPRTEIVVEADEEKKEDDGFWGKMIKDTVQSVVKSPEGVLAGVAAIAKGSPLGQIAETASVAMTAAKAAARASGGVATMGGGSGWGGGKPSA